MKALGSCTLSRRFSRLARRRWHQPRSAVLSLVLLGLSIGISNAQTTTTSQPREHVYLLRGFANVFSLGVARSRTSCSSRASTPPSTIIWRGRA